MSGGKGKQTFSSVEQFGRDVWTKNNGVNQILKKKLGKMILRESIGNPETLPSAPSVYRCIGV